jgi:hypothetical protein
MSIKVKIKLPTIEERIKKLIKFDRVVFQVATRLKLLLMQNWSKGKGADGGKFKKLSTKYENKKSKSGRTPIRNLLFTGNMLQDLDPVKKTDFNYTLKFRSANERKKALGNVEHAPNMMKPVSDRIDGKLQKYAFDLYSR